MALETARAAYNTKLIELLALWDDLIDGLSPGDALLLIPVRENLGAASTAVLPPTDPLLQNKTAIAIKRATNDASIKYAIAGNYLEGLHMHTPLFWFITNNAGEIA